MKLYSLTEAAKLLRKSRQWMWLLVQMHRVQAEKIGNQYVVKEDDLKKLMSAN